MLSFESCSALVIFQYAEICHAMKSGSTRLGGQGNVSCRESGLVPCGFPFPSNRSKFSCKSGRSGSLCHRQGMVAVVLYCDDKGTMGNSSFRSNLVCCELDSNIFEGCECMITLLIQAWSSSNYKPSHLLHRGLIGSTLRKERKKRLTKHWQTTTTQSQWYEV